MPRASLPGDSSSKSHPTFGGGPAAAPSRRISLTYALMSIDDAAMGLGSAAPLRTMPNSVSTPQIFWIATPRPYRLPVRRRAPRSAVEVERVTELRVLGQVRGDRDAEVRQPIAGRGGDHIEHVPAVAAD